MTKDRHFKKRVRSRMNVTGETYTDALAAERRTRPPPRGKQLTNDTLNDESRREMNTKSAYATRLRGIWLGVRDRSATQTFYEKLGAHFDETGPTVDIFHATLGGTRLVFEDVSYDKAQGSGPFLLFDVTDADGLYEQLRESDVDIVSPPKNEAWGRQFNVLDPDGHSIAFIGPNR